LRPFVHQLGQPEVENLYSSVLSDEDVFRLEIGMDDSGIVPRA
jgi:hypothetical protein